MESFDTMIIGAGHAGLSAGHHLARTGRSFVILHADERVGDVWRRRYDSLRLFTPSYMVRLPGMRLSMKRWDAPTRDQFADFLEAYAARFSMPVRGGVRVDSVRRDGDTYVVEAGARAVRGRERRPGRRCAPHAEAPRVRERARSDDRAAALDRATGTRRSSARARSWSSGPGTRARTSRWSSRRATRRGFRARSADTCPSTSTGRRATHRVPGRPVRRGPRAHARDAGRAAGDREARGQGRSAGPREAEVARPRRRPPGRQDRRRRSTGVRCSRTGRISTSRT